MANKTKWSIDQARSTISFKVRHLIIGHVKGAFKTFNAGIYSIDKDLTTAEIDLWIDASSITTGDEERDAHLKGADFFDVQNHRVIAFTSTSIENPDVDGNHELWGRLTMKGISKIIRLKVQFEGILNDHRGKERTGLTVTGKINRTDWGLNWNSTLETGGLMVSEEVIISCEVELTNADQKDQVRELEAAAGEKGMP